LTYLSVSRNDKGVRSMTDQEFVNAIRKKFLDEDVEIYRDFLSHPSTGIYGYFHEHLDESGRQTLLRLLRIVAVDTLARFFGLLDGVSFIEDQGDDVFELVVSGKKLNSLRQRNIMKRKREYGLDK
ncbi:MAG: hypothetical protein K8R46_03350, partial [Pirellulales bacterium]|nr:hypothetical protein [Pirellulales bacterium]